MRADPAHVDPDLPFGEACQDSVGAGGDVLEHVVVGNGGEDDVGGFGDFARRVAPAESLLDKVLRGRAVTGFAEHGVPGGEEAGGHVSAHVSEAYEAERIHEVLPSSSSTSSSVSWRFAASRIGSTWAGRRTSARRQPSSG